MTQPRCICTPNPACPIHGQRSSPLLKALSADLASEWTPGDAEAKRLKTLVEPLTKVQALKIRSKRK